jgi:alpha-L-fucosidase 2
MSNNILIQKTPAMWNNNKCMDATPLGNGLTGVLIEGGVKTENITINRHNLWQGMKKNPIPDISYTLKEVRKHLDNYEFEKSNSLACEELKKKEYYSKLNSQFSVCNLKLNFNISDPFYNYRRILDMETGECKVTYVINKVRFERKYFVSRKDDIIVIKISATKGEINGNVEALLHHNMIPTVFTGDYDGMSKFIEFTKGALKAEYIDNYIYYYSKNDDSTYYGCIVKIISKKSKANTFTDENEVFILVKAFSNCEKLEEIGKFKAIIDEIIPNYENLLKEHSELHRNLYNSSQIELCSGKNISNEELLLKAYEKQASLELIEKMYKFGRYLFISGSSENSLPFPLYGLWHYGIGEIWSQHVANENVQLIYAHLFTGGLVELVKPLIDYYNSLIDDFRENAKKIFGCKGIYVTAYTSPKVGLVAINVPVILNYMSAGGWLCQYFYKYSLYTNDIKTTKEKILPFMKEVADFFEDFCIIENGKLKIYPSVSPENSPINIIPSDKKINPIEHGMPTAINSTMDFAILKENLINLLELSRKYEVYKEKIEVWEAMLSKIPNYMINKDGAIKEWMKEDFEDNYNHRHLSHLYPVFPGNEITYESNKQLMQAFSKAVKLRELGGQSGWSLTHTANVFARLQKGNNALAYLDTMFRSCTTNSLITLHNDWRDMGLTVNMALARQLDANMGFVNAIQEMLLYVSNDLIKILPACPKRFKIGKVINFATPEGRVSFEWDFDKGIFKGEFHVKKAITINILLPNLVFNDKKIFNNYKYNIKCDDLCSNVKIEDRLIKIDSQGECVIGFGLI